MKFLFVIEFSFLLVVEFSGESRFLFDIEFSGESKFLLITKVGSNDSDLSGGIPLDTPATETPLPHPPVLSALDVVCGCGCGGCDFLRGRPTGFGWRFAADGGAG